MTPAANRRSPTGDRAGFTLIELLVVLALLGAMSTMLFGGVQLGLKSWQRGKTTSEVSEEIMTVQRFLRQRIEKAQPFFEGSIITTGRAPFEGHGDAMIFSSTLPEQIDRGGLSRLAIGTGRSGGGQDLEVSWVIDRSGRRDPTSSLDGRSAKLLEGARDIRFSYFGAAEGEGGPRWSEAWTGRQGLPMLVRIEIEFDDEDPRRWPELIMRTVIDMDAGCIYDPVSKNCRGR